MRITRMIAIPMLPCAIAAILLISASVVALSPVSAYSQTEPSSIPVYKSIVSSSSSADQQQMQQQSKVIEASGHFANNQIENSSVSS